MTKEKYLLKQNNNELKGINIPDLKRVKLRN